MGPVEGQGEPCALAAGICLSSQRSLTRGRDGKGTAEGEPASESLFGGAGPPPAAWQKSGCVEGVPVPDSLTKSILGAGVIQPSLPGALSSPLLLQQGEKKNQASGSLFLISKKNLQTNTIGNREDLFLGGKSLFLKPSHRTREFILLNADDLLQC